MTDQFQPLTGCGVLPPREDTKQRESRNNTAGGSGGIETKPQGSDNRRKIAGRFAVFNGFVDFTLADLSLRETKVWLILYRDSRDGIAKTSQADIARRAGVSDRATRAIDTARDCRSTGQANVVEFHSRGVGGGVTSVCAQCPRIEGGSVLSAELVDRCGSPACVGLGGSQGVV